VDQHRETTLKLSCTPSPGKVCEGLGHGTPLYPAEMSIVVATERFAVVAEDICHLQRRTHTLRAMVLPLGASVAVFSPANSAGRDMGIARLAVHVALDGLGLNDADATPPPAGGPQGYAGRISCRGRIGPLRTTRPRSSAQLRLEGRPDQRWQRVRQLVKKLPGLTAVGPLLEALVAIRSQCAVLHRLLLDSVRDDPVCWRSWLFEA
jgi:hypothetical protein